MTATNGYCWREPSRMALFRNHGAVDGGLAAVRQLGVAGKRNRNKRPAGGQGEASARRLRNRASHGLWVSAKDLPGMLRLWRWTNCEIDGKPGTRGIFSCALENKMEISVRYGCNRFPTQQLGLPSEIFGPNMWTISPLGGAVSLVLKPFETRYAGFPIVLRV